MKVLFCNIAYMDYYRGMIENVDVPTNMTVRGKSPSEAEEQYNFLACNLDEGGDDVCLGYFPAKSTQSKGADQVHIEKMPGVENNAEVVDNVLVVWCAKKEGTENRTVVVGWYKNAKVYRYYQEAIFGDGDEEFHQLYNVVAKAKDCVLLPPGERSRYTKWNVPRKKGSNGPAFGFTANTNIWFANEEKAKDYIEKMVERIDDYYDDNYMLKELNLV
jgi:hypothetical protein